MGNLFKKNLNLKLISLAFAIFLWIYVYYKENPFKEYQAMANFVVPLETVNLSSDFLVVDIPKQVLVKISGDKNLISQKDVADHIEAYVDLDGKKSGNFKGLVVMAGSTVGQVEGIEPPAVDVSIEEIITREFKVRLDFEGEPKEGVYVEKGLTTITPSTVELKGPSSLIKKVHMVSVSIDIDDVSLTFERMKPPLILDSNDKSVKGLEVKPSEVKVNVLILSENHNKTVPIVPWIYGTLPEGYRISEVLVQPLTATIEARREELDTIDSIRTSPIDITGKTEDIVLQEVLILAHRGAKVISSDTVQVLIRIEKEPEPVNTPTPVPTPKKDKKDNVSG